MTNKTVHISVVFNPKGRTDRHGRSKICICVNHSGEKRKYYDCGLSVEKKYFDNDKGRVKENRSTPPEYGNYNKLILNKLQEIETAKTAILQKYGYFSLAKLDAELNQKTKICDLFAFIDELCRINDHKLAFATIQNYRTTKKHLLNFRKTIYIQDVDRQFLQEFERYLMDFLSQNTASKYLRNLRTFMHEAVKHDIITYAEYPFHGYQVPPQKYPRNKKFLTEDEAEKIKRCKMRTDAEEMAKDMFIFSVYSGLRFSDVVNLTPDNIEGEGEQTTLVFCSQKTDTPQRLPIGWLSKDAVLMLNEYNNKRTEKKYFCLTNQFCNRVLKDIAEKCGINKKITFHFARHTFATYWLNNGLTMAQVQHLLGHKSIKTTEIYAECTDNGVIEDIKRIKQNILKRECHRTPQHTNKII